jgi:hypothetical protein
MLAIQDEWGNLFQRAIDDLVLQTKETLPSMHGALGKLNLAHNGIALISPGDPATDPRRHANLGPSVTRRP